MTENNQTAKAYQIRITLKGAKPPIWRRVALPANVTLGELHVVIQIVMGWTDDHLHQFMLKSKGRKQSWDVLAGMAQEGRWDEMFTRTQETRVFGPSLDPMGGELDMDGEDEDAVTLGEVCPKVKSKLIYEYDFGDGWQHVIEVQKIIEPGVEQPVCLAGKKACPPEDCGGLWGYYGLLEAVADPKHEQHEDMLEWLGGEFDPDAFDLEEVNTILAEWWNAAG